MRIPVSDLLHVLAEGVSSEAILLNYPDLELADIHACLLYAARRANLERLVALFIVLTPNYSQSGRLAALNGFRHDSFATKRHAHSKG